MFSLSVFRLKFVSVSLGNAVGAQTVRPTKQEAGAVQQHAAQQQQRLRSS